MKVRNVILIAARLKSRRLEKKIIKRIAGKELLVHLIERLQLIKSKPEIIVCTSINKQDKPINELCNKINVKCFNGSEDDVMGRFISALKYFDINPHNIARVTADNCLIAYELIDQAFDLHIKEKADVTFMNNLPLGMSSEVINYDYFKKLYENVEDPNSSEYMTWMLDRPDLCKIATINLDEFNRPNYRVTCDTPEDFELIQTIFKNLYDGVPIRSKNVITFLDENPRLLKINENISQIDYVDVKDHINIKVKKFKNENKSNL